MAVPLLRAALSAALKPSMAVRALCAALLLCCEKLLLDTFVDFNAAQTAQGLGEFVRVGQHFGFRFLVSFGISLAMFSYVRKDVGISQLNDEARLVPLRWPWLLLHAVCVSLLVPLSYSLYGNHGLNLPFSEIVVLWILFAFGAVLAVGAAIAPWAFWYRLRVLLGVLWLYASLAAFAAASAMLWSQRLWAPTAKLTFDLVRRLLSPLLPTLQSDSTLMILGTDRFTVQVAEVCSGLEGVGLMLAFCCAWLVYFRKEYIFPRALLLIPTGLLLIFLLNVVRIAGLVVIGNAGYPEVAVFGFHSQAGWIAFNIAACGIVVVSRRSRWLSHADSQATATAGDNPTAAYLVPFLAIIAVGMLAQASSNGFELLYPLRLIAAAAALWAFRTKLASLDWGFSWRGPVSGLILGLLWLFAARHWIAPSGMPVALAEMNPISRNLWIAGRVCAALVTVPLAEELAFRGFLLRRLQNADFEAVQFELVGWAPLALSSLVFGLAHGALWLPGVVAGLVFGGLLKLTGRFGEAVSAHVTSNAILATWVLAQNQWQLW